MAQGGQRRDVRSSAGFDRKAKQLFPPEGSSEGRPTYQMFVDGPLKAFEAAFRYWENNSMPVPGLGSLRYAEVIHAPFFPLITAYACLVADAGGDYVELVDFDVEWDIYLGDEEEHL